MHRPPADPSGRLAALTAREREVRTLIARSRSNTEIGQDLAGSGTAGGAAGVSAARCRMTDRLGQCVGGFR
jgi:FixJ family two-component response regulator